MVSYQRYIAFIIGALFYAFVLLTRNLPVIVPDILCQKFHLSETVFGQFRGLYYLTYCIAHLPMAYALDRFGPRSVMALSLCLCVLGLSPMLWSDSATMLIIGRMLLGVGASTGILSVFKINRSFFEPQQFATLLGIAGTTGYVASVAGFGPLQRLFNTIGYETTLLGIFAIGLTLAALSFLCIRSVQGHVPGGFVDSIKQLIKNRSFWTVALIGGLIIWGTEGFADGWSVPLLTSLFHFDQTRAVDITSIVAVGFAIGSIVLPWIAQKFDSSKQLFGLSGLISSLCLIGLFIPEIPTWLILVLYSLIGCFAAYQVLCVDWGGKVVIPELSTLASAAINMLIMSFGYLFHTFSALMMNGKGITDANCGAVTYLRTDLVIGLSPFIICGFVAYVINRYSIYNQPNKEER